MIRNLLLLLYLLFRMMIDAMVSSMRGVKRGRDWETTDNEASHAKKCIKNAIGKEGGAISVMHRSHHDPDMTSKLEFVVEKESACLLLDEMRSVLLKRNRLVYPPVLRCPTRNNIHERYNLHELLGSGGNASTYMCIQKATGIKYACKIIEKAGLISEEDRKKVRFEICMMTYLRGHPNVVKIEGTYEDCEKVYIVMELCQGGELFDRMVNVGVYPEHKAAATLHDIIQALKYCHERRIIHRDLKPENVLYSTNAKDATLKIIDFGLSTFFKPGQKFNKLVGTYCYMAPEVITGQHGKEVDIWSAGIILCNLLTGEYPFYGENDREIAKSTITRPIDFEGEAWSKISSEAKDLVRGMLTHDPEKRLTAQQVLEHPWLSKEHLNPN